MEANSAKVNYILLSITSEGGTTLRLKVGTILPSNSMCLRIFKITLINNLKANHHKRENGIIGLPFDG